MTTYNQQSHANIGDLLTASMYNTGLDNIHALWTNAAAGAMPYWSAANVMAALLKPSGQAMMTHNGTIPSWLGIGSTGQVLTVASGAHAWARLDAIHAIGIIDNFGTTQTTTSTSLVDVTGATVNLTLTRTCKIIVFGSMVGYTSDSGGSYPVRFALSIDGTVTDKVGSYSPYATTIAMLGYKSAVAAGTRTVKVQFRIGTTGYTAGSFGGYLAAIAMPD